MPSTIESPELKPVGAALHAALCEVSAKPGAAWVEAHHDADRRLAKRFLEHLHVGGHMVSPIEICGGVPSDDFLAGVA